MTSAAMRSATKSRIGLAFWGDLWSTTRSYLAWGYGALALSLVGFGIYALSMWISKHL